VILYAQSSLGTLKMVVLLLYIFFLYILCFLWFIGISVLAWLIMILYFVILTFNLSLSGGR
jgi:hypothetical protein